MKVKELISLLKNYHDDEFVVFRSGFNVVEEVTGVYEWPTDKLYGTYNQAQVVVIGSDKDFRETK